MKRRILLMYISESSGHYRASCAVEKACRELFDDVETLNVNSFHYTNPILEKIINSAYTSVIKRKPEFWGYLYDNPRIVKKSQRLKDAIHKYSSSRMKTLLENFRPHAVICTQAFPCGIIADCKKTHGTDVLLAGILTDYAPHSYWMYDNVDLYFVPSEETKERLVANGISKDKIKLTGIPIDSKFKKVIDKKRVADSLGIPHGKSVVLIMGGSQGLGPIKEIIKSLDASPADFHTIVVCGVNRKLYRSLKKIVPRFGKKVLVLPYTDNVDELMQVSSLVISKPGGITISEALAKGLPLIIIKPIPGQEQMNTDHLLKYKLALKADNLPEVGVLVTELLSNPQALRNMSERVKSFAKPNSALDIAQVVLERIV